MLRKSYLCPSMEAWEVESETVLAESGLTSEIGIDYGGVDEFGEKDPETRCDDLIEIIW